MQNFKGRGDLNLVARDCSKRVEFCLPSGNTPTLEQTVLVSLTKIDFLYFLLTVCTMKHNVKLVMDNFQPKTHARQQIEHNTAWMVISLLPKF